MAVKKSAIDVASQLVSWSGRELSLRRWFSLVCVGAVFSVCLHASASDEGGQRKSQTKVTEKSAGENSSQGRETSEQSEADAVLAFVGEYQPRLLKLMKYLEEKHPAQYRQAVREMGRAKTRLEGLKKRDESMHAVELELWQLRSEQRLVAAELATLEKSAKRKAGEDKLERLIVRESEKNLERLRLLREKALAQVQRLENQIERTEASQATWVEKQLKTWKNQIQKQLSRPSGSEGGQRSQSKATPSKASPKTERDHQRSGQ